MAQLSLLALLLLLAGSTLVYAQDPPTLTITDEDGSPLPTLSYSPDRPKFVLNCASSEAFTSINLQNADGSVFLTALTNDEEGDGYKGRTNYEETSDTQAKLTISSTTSDDWCLDVNGYICFAEPATSPSPAVYLGAAQEVIYEVNGEPLASDVATYEASEQATITCCVVWKDDAPSISVTVTQDDTELPTGDTTTGAECPYKTCVEVSYDPANGESTLTCKANINVSNEHTETDIKTLKLSAAADTTVADATTAAATTVGTGTCEEGSKPPPTFAVGDEPVENGSEIEKEPGEYPVQCKTSYTNADVRVDLTESASGDQDITPGSSDDAGCYNAVSMISYTLMEGETAEFSCIASYQGEDLDPVTFKLKAGSGSPEVTTMAPETGTKKNGAAKNYSGVLLSILGAMMMVLNVM